MRMTMRVAAAAALALACGGGSGGGQAGCRANTECAQGLVCVVPAAGGGGTCQAVPLQIALTAPSADARIGPAGAVVTADVTLGAAGAVAPASLTMVANGEEVGTLAKKSESGVDVVYEGRYAPAPGASFTAPFVVLAKTTAGFVLSNGVVVVVDTKPPALSILSPGTGRGCGALPACPRDGVLDVVVGAEEDHPDVLEVALDLDNFAATVPLAPATQSFVATVPLATYPFPHFNGTVTARVHARDSFGNESTLDLSPFPMTRLRWAFDAGAPITGAAVSTAGEAVFGVSSTTDNLRAVKPDGTEAWRATLAAPGRITGSFIVSAPSLGATTTWVGSEDGRLYGRPDTGVVFSCPQAAVVAGAMFTPAILPGTPDNAFSGGASATLIRATSTPECLPASGISTGDPIDASPVSSAGKLFAVTSRAARSKIHRFSTVPAEELAVLTTCANILAPPTVDPSGDILISCAGGEIVKLDHSTLAPAVLTTLSDAAQESIVVHPSGDLIVGANDGNVHRLTPPVGGTGPWAEAWLPAPALASPVTGTLVAEPDASGAVVYAVTASGSLHALAGDGHEVWSTVPAGAPLGSFPLTFPTVAPAAAGHLPTLYVGSAEGKLYAVVVDKGLDPTSPWPKSHHDIRNTGNAAAPLP